MHTFSQFASSQTIIETYLDLCRITCRFQLISYVGRFPYSKKNILRSLSKHFTISYILIQFSISFLYVTPIMCVLVFCIYLFFSFVYPFVFLCSSGKAHIHQQNNLFGQNPIYSNLVLFLVENVSQYN